MPCGIQPDPLRSLKTNQAAYQSFKVSFSHSKSKINLSSSYLNIVVQSAELTDWMDGITISGFKKSQDSQYQESLVQCFHFL